MKRVIILLFIFFVFGTMTAFAEFSKSVDSFDGSTTIRSKYNYSSAFRTNFARIIILGKTEGTFLTTYVTATRIEGWYFFSNVAEMKVDDNPNIYTLKITDSNSNMDNGLLNTRATIDIEPEISDIIKKANKITIRYFFNNQQPLTLDFPDKILQEWKQVLNYQK